ncbi:MAG: hypothetical protein C5B58_03390 [Acidobacteria bacterium]|nr:MAG: hypothetical protein C5B58_03390 [Acidobacteriota bacterium]
MASSNARVLELLEEMLESGRTPEEVCADCPELLDEVRRRWQSFRLIDDEFVALLPDSDTRRDPDALRPLPPPEELPQIPGYLVEGILGSGGMGVVYRAWHLRLDRVVALKMLLAGPRARPDELARFLREAQAVAALRHPNIVQVYDVGDVDGRPYFTMELIEGGDLAGKLQGAPQPALEAAALIATLADAIHFAHQNGIVHRDLKPGNILITRDGAPKVTDFGLALRLHGDGALTLSGMQMGTPSYMSPCQARGDKTAIGPATDVYALGAILYEALTGRPPFRGDNATATLQQVISDDPVPPSRLNPRVPRDLETICLKCLRKEPQNRYASAEALADDLRRFERGEPIKARPPSFVGRSWKWARRRPAMAGMLVAIALLVVGLTVGIGMYLQQQAIEQAHQAQTDQMFRDIMERARKRLDEGWAAADLKKVSEANTMATRAIDLAHGHGAKEETRLEAKSFHDHAAGRLQRLEKDLALLEALRDVSAPHETVTFLSKRGSSSFLLAQPGADEQYADAFRRWGLDIDDTPAAEAVARLSAEPEAVVQEMIACLDSWMLQRRRERPAADWRRLRLVADQLDRSAQRRQFRAFLVGEAPPRPEGVASLVGMGSPWLVPWELTRGSVWRPLLELRKGIDPRTEPVPTVMLLAHACADGGDVAAAEKVLRQAATARPEDPLLLTALGKLLDRQDGSRLAEAIGYYRAARSRSRQLGLALSQALVSAGKAGEAEEVLRDLALQPALLHNYAVPFFLGDALMAQRRYAEAEAAYREALRLRPGSTAAQINLGAALIEQRNYGPAEAALRKALEREPVSVSALANLGLALNGQGKYGEAETACRKALHADSDCVEALHTLGNALLHQGKYGPAEAASRRAAAIRPKNAAILATLSGALYGQGQHDQAEVACREAIALKPGLAVAHYTLGEILLVQGQYRKAEAAYRAAIDLKLDGLIMPIAHNGLGGALLKQRKLGEAEEAFRKALTLKPEYSLAHGNLGSALLQLGQFDEAATALQSACDSLPAADPRRKHLRQLQDQCAQFAALSVRLPAILKGTEKPANTSETIAFAYLCRFRRQYVPAARFFLDALTADPKLARGLPSYCYEAATTAALAGAGQGKDAAQLDDKERAHWRRQSLTWLRKDLTEWDRVLQKGNAKAKAQLPLVMREWQADQDLAGLREPDALTKLPPDERAECLALWEEVAALLRRAQTTK